MSGLPEVVALSLAWAVAATALVCVPGTVLAYLLANDALPAPRLLSSLVSLPLVLPPTAVGYLLLRLLADDGPLGHGTLGFDLDVLFTPKAVVLACAVMAFPLYVRTARVGFEAIDPRFRGIARSLGCRPVAAFVRVTLPLAFRSLLAAAILAFTRALGEFGATMVIAGNIPGRTQTLASAIFSAQQTGDSQRATVLVCLALLIGFIAVYATEWLAAKPSQHPA